MKLEVVLTIALMVITLISAAIFGVFKNTISNGNERMVVVELKIKELQKYCCSEIKNCE